MPRTLMLAVVLLLLAGCYVANAPAQPLTPTALQTTTTLDPLPTYPPAINPLTGMPVPNAAVLARRPMIVKISNAPLLVRPQAGLGAADIVYEHYTEGGLTRFSAVFYSQAPQRIGSIRSARLIDNQLVPMYNGLLAFSGASIGVEEVINSADYFERTYKGITPYFYRDETLDAPHNLFLNAETLFALAAQEGYAQQQPLTGMLFSDAPPDDSVGSANLIDISYTATRANWVYDAAQRRYLRFSDGLAHADANSGAQIAASNVVILFADHQLTDIIESQWQGVNSYSIAINLMGEGDAILVRDGQRYNVRWLRPQRDQLLRLVQADGTPIPLRAGITWYQVFPLPDQQQRPEEIIIGG
jgi:Protein of unknown function (DUF3048) N-terminal domain/Protein of unknown function (DUF3048) C-terminal domain